MTDHGTIFEADIDTLSAALTSGALTSVELVAKYLLRISTYDCRNTRLNAIPLINPNVFDEAAKSDERRTRRESLGPLDGIPFTLKDSYMVKGMTVADGSEAFKNLRSTDDAFVLQALRKSGAVLMGKTNMCPMAYGGMLRGVYGRAESPYNSEYLAAAFGSGSSNGSGASTAASFAAFGIGGETVSSGRSPASNNSLIAYTPSRGVISLRNSWPLYVTCDVLISHTKSMQDLFAILPVLGRKDAITTGDFWRDQSFVEIPHINDMSTFQNLAKPSSLSGKRFACPLNLCKRVEDGPYVSSEVWPLMEQAKQDLESAGAIVEFIDELSVLEIYEQALSGAEGAVTELPANWNTIERSELIAHGWEDFLELNNDSGCKSLADVDYRDMFPQLDANDPQKKFTDPVNAVHWSKLAGYVTDRKSTNGRSPLYDVPHLEKAVKGLEHIRKEYFEKWMTNENYDFVCFPAVGDVAKAVADIDDESAEHAWRLGVRYSHGNKALRHLGIPGVTVPMGDLQTSQMPIGLTILGKAYDDRNILETAYVYEQKSKRRRTPPLTPELPSDKFSSTSRPREPPPILHINKCTAKSTSPGSTEVVVEGVISEPGSDGIFKPVLDIFVDGQAISTEDIRFNHNGGTFQFFCRRLCPSPPANDNRTAVNGRVARDSTMVMVKARIRENGKPAGYVKVIHSSEQSE